MINETMYGLGNALLRFASFLRMALSERLKLAKTRFSISASATPASQLPIR